MNVQKVYLVISYPDPDDGDEFCCAEEAIGSEVVLAAYATKEAAELHAKLAQDWQNEKDKRFEDEGYESSHNYESEENPYDPGENYGSRDYTVQEVPFYLHPDQFLGAP